MVSARILFVFGFTQVKPRCLIWLVYSFFLAFSSLGCIASYRQQQTQSPESSTKLDAVGVNHKVKPGETLWRISQQYGVKVEDLMFSNNLSDPSRLQAGQILFIPGVSQTNPNPASAATEATSNSEKGSYSQDVQPRLRLSWPLQGVLYARFGKRGETHHDGIDIAAPKGTLISSAGDGKVIFSGYQNGYGNLVIIQHSPRLLTIYAHNKKNLVREGKLVRQGDSIAQVGITSNSSSGPHLHFEVRVGALPKDPLQYLPPR